MGYLTWWSFPRKAWIMIISEFVVIAFLSSWVYVQYLSDIYFQAYVNGMAPVLIPALSVTFGISSASVAAYFYIGMRKIRAIETPESQISKKPQTRKTHREAPPSPQTDPKPNPTNTTGKPKLRPLAAPRYHAHSETTHSKEREPPSETSQN